MHIPPTEKQIRYLQTLAKQRGVTYQVPVSKRQASFFIDKLKKQPAIVDLPEHEAFIAELKASVKE